MSAAIVVSGMCLAILQTSAMLKKWSDRILHILTILSNLTVYVACCSPKSSDAENITGLKKKIFTKNIPAKQTW